MTLALPQLVQRSRLTKEAIGAFELTPKRTSAASSKMASWRQCRHRTRITELAGFTAKLWVSLNIPGGHRVWPTAASSVRRRTAIAAAAAVSRRTARFCTAAADLRVRNRFLSKYVAPTGESRGRPRERWVFRNGLRTAFRLSLAHRKRARETQRSIRPCG
jgi:hypothetical protein